MIEKRLQELGIELPPSPKPAANYLPCIRTGSLVLFSGQICLQDGQIKYKGKVGADLTIEQGQAAAQLCALNLLACLKEACVGDLNKVQRCIRLGGFVNCHEDFVDHPKVMNGASDLLVNIFGEHGRHVRSAIGVPSLPFDSAVEIDAIFELKA